MYKFTKNEKEKYRQTGERVFRPCRWSSGSSEVFLCAEDLGHRDTSRAFTDTPNAESKCQEGVSIFYFVTFSLRLLQIDRRLFIWKYKGRYGDMILLSFLRAQVYETTIATDNCRYPN